MRYFTIPELKKPMDEVVADPALQPDQPKKGMTYCNIAMFRIIQGLNFNRFWHEKAERPMMANEMIDYMNSHPLEFSKLFNPITAYDMANNGYLVIAALSGIPHGHVTAIYPKQDLYTSGTLKAQVPYCCNVGPKKGFGIVPLSYAFREIPDFFICL